jgi:HEAT repeat protein
MLSADRSYKDLVGEIQSKSFGNKWVAAYELSKQINSTQIPESDYPWLVENLTSAYKDSVDPRTRGFIIAALGALRSELCLPTFSLSIKDVDSDVKFHTVVSLANMPKGFVYDWSEIIALIKSNENNLRQASVLALATHQVLEAKDEIRTVLGDPNRLLRYAAATALIAYKDEAAIESLKEILMLKYPTKEARVQPPELDYNQISELKLSVLNTLRNNNWTLLNEDILETAQKDENNSVATKAKEVLIYIEKISDPSHNLSIEFF